MGKTLYAVVAAVASLALVSSLTCNKCSYGLAGFCLSNSDVECSTNTSVCYTEKITFSSISTSVGFNIQGCREPAGCNITSNSSLVGVQFEMKVDCCSTDRCNPVKVSSAPATKTTFAGIIGAAVLASVYGSTM